MRLIARFLGPLRVLAVATAAVGVAYGAGVRLNLSPSVPRGVYLLESGAPVRGALVAACLPLEFARLGHKRGYLGPGRCPGNAAPALKLVGAVGGDVLETFDGVRVNGDLLQPASPTRDRHGRPLTTYPAGRFKLGPGQIWLYSSSPHSWDSRFFGPILIENVSGTVQPLWR